MKQILTAQSAENTRIGSWSMWLKKTLKFVIYQMAKKPANTLIFQRDQD